MSVKRNSHVNLLGDKELKRMLKELPGVSFRKVVRPALNKAATPVLKAMKGNAAAFAETKALKNALGKKMVTYPKNLAVAAIIGARRGQQYIRYDRHGRKRSPAFYVHLAEAGAAPHHLKLEETGRRESFVDKRGRHRTRKIYSKGGAFHPGAKGHYFMKRAWDSTRTTALQIVANEVAARVPIEAKRLATKGNA